MPNHRLSTAALVAAGLAVVMSTGPAPAAVAHDGPHAPASAPSHAAVTAESTVRLGAGDLSFESVANWCRLPDERPLGNTHGGIVIDGDGRVYYNTDTDRAIMVHAADGSFLRSLAPELPAIHGMQLRDEPGPDGTLQTFIYAAHLRGKQVVKLTLDGTVVWSIGLPVESGKYDDGPAGYNPTAVAVAPGGDIYIADGYGRNWIHQYDAERNYIRSFGGPGESDGQFRTCHGMVIDTRGTEPMLLVCDRENRRLQRFRLDGTFVDVVATGLRRPCGLSIRGDEIAVAELEGRVTILGPDFEVLAHLGDNPQRNQWANNGVPPAAWLPGVFTAPHAVCFDAAGDLYVMDWNAAGRISKLRRVAADPAAADAAPTRGE